MIPSPVTTHVAESQDLLTSMFRGRRVISGLLKAYTKQVQLLEDAIWVVLSERSLATEFDSVLDLFGAIVGEARNGRTNAYYRAAIRIRIRVNRYNGTQLALIRILRLAAAGHAWGYRPYWPACFEVAISTPAEYRALADLASLCRPPGVQVAALFCPAGLDGTQEYGSTTDPDAGTPWPSSIDSAIPFVSAHVETI
jgi:hypothetical protein